MIFASFEFLLLFLPIFFFCYFAVPFVFRNAVIVLFSWAFYAWWRVDFLVLLLCVTVGTFSVARLMGAVGPTGTAAKRLLLVGLVFNLGILGYFKYANFGVSTFNDLFTAFGRPPAAWAQIVLPIGLSFYVLQSVSYLIDVHRGDVPVSRSFVQYAVYKAIFAQLIAGPIVRYAEIASELKWRVHSLQLFGEGARLVMLGFAMKVVFGDTLGPVVAAAFALEQPTLADAWVGTAAYTLQLYFDFAGYSLLAIGLARMMGFHFPTNFNHPYLATSVQNFWQRWHMTLSRFLRDYLYIPLGGNRHGVLRTYVNLMLVMAIGGAWHGASWNFIIWGCWHGSWLSLHRAWSRGRPVRTPTAGVWLTKNLATMLMVMLGWVVFRAPDLHGAARMYAGLLGLHGFDLSDALAWQIPPDRWGGLVLAGIAVYLPLLRDKIRLQTTGNGRSAIGAGVYVLTPIACFALGIVLLYSRDAVPFLYFQF